MGGEEDRLPTQLLSMCWVTLSQSGGTYILEWVPF